MQVTPLVLHAAMRLPSLTALFSDPLPASSLTIAPGGNVTVTLTRAAGVPAGSQLAIAITDAAAPNGVTAAAVLANGDITITVAFDHDLTGTPNPAEYEPWDAFVTLSGFTNPLVNGRRQLVAVPDRRTFVVRPGGPVSPVTLTGAEVLLERLPPGVTGWHAASVTGPVTLTFPAPASATRALTVANPVIVRNIRAFGAIDFNTARRKLAADDAIMALESGHLFIVPRPEVRTSRSRSSKTDALHEIGPGVDLRQMIIDGFEVIAFLPAKGSSAGVGPLDLCQGPLFAAIMRTFNGLALPRPELADGNAYAALLEVHGPIYYDGAVYAHRYVFQSPAVYTNADAIAPWEQAEIPPLAAGAAPDTIVPVGATVFNGIEFAGILHDSQPQPLTGSFTLE